MNQDGPSLIIEALRPPPPPPCGTLKCENAAICEKVAKCGKKINAKCENGRYMWKNNAKCEKIRLSKCVEYFDSKCVKTDAIYVQTLFWRYLWKSNFNAFLISER